MNILHFYERPSDQQVNVEKLAVFFSYNTSEVVIVGRMKRQEFRAIKDRIWAMIRGWKGKLLSHAGKAILIQAVAQAIPLHYMSCYKDA